MENIDIKVYELDSYMPLIIIEPNNQNEELESLKKMFYDDFDEKLLKNISEEKLIKRVKRYQKIVNKLKEIYQCKCQICGETFLMDNGEYYCEAHHIIPISEDGDQDPYNVLILCANHHRMFHYAKSRIRIGQLIKNKRIIFIDDLKYVIEFECR